MLVHGSGGYERRWRLGWGYAGLTLVEIDVGDDEGVIMGEAVMVVGARKEVMVMIVIC